MVAALVERSADGQLNASDETAAVRQRLADYKAPRMVIFVDQVPRTPNGKVDYPAAEGLLASSSR